MRDRSWLLACVLSCLCSPVVAGGFEVDFGFGGWSVPSRWAPLRISCDGAPAEAVAEITRIDAEGREGPTESFPLGRFPQVECPVHVDPGAYRLRIRLVAKGELLAERSLLPGGKTFPGQVVLCIGLPETVRRAIAESLRPLEPVQAIDLPLSRLPALALDLDGIAGIALREGSGDLSPAQRSAVAAWSASGGRLVALSEGELSGDRALSPSYWRERLALFPFGQDGRLSAGRIAAASGSRPTPGSSSLEADYLVALGLAAWALALFLLTRRKHGFAWIGLIAVLLGFAAFPVARAVDAGHTGLGRLAARVLYLDGSTFLVDASVACRKPSWDLDLSALMPSRPLRFSVAKTESGIVPSDGRPARLVHSAGSPVFSIMTGKAAGLELWNLSSGMAGAMPTSPEDWSRMSGRKLALVRGGSGSRWFAPGPMGWQALPSAPDFIGAELAWVEALRSIRKGEDFVVGRDPSPDPFISLAGAGRTDVLWALPLATGRADRDREGQP